MSEGRRETKSTMLGMDAKFTPAGNLLISNPTANDVLFGRGASMFHWPGNAKFRELVSKKTEVYLSATCRARKHSIAKEIIERVRSGMNGRFLIKASAIGDECVATDGGPGPWVLAEESLVFDKVKQAIREKHYQEKKPGSKANPGSSRKPKAQPESRMENINSQEGGDSASEAVTSSEALEKTPDQDLLATKVDTRAHENSSKKNPDKAAQGHVTAGSHTRTKRERTQPDRPPRHYEAEQGRKRQRLQSPSREWQQQSQGWSEEAQRNQVQDAVHSACLGQGALVNELIRRHQEEELVRRVERRFEPTNRHLTSMYDVTSQLGSLPFAIGKDESLSDRFRHNTDRFSRNGREGGYPVMTDRHRPLTNDALVSQRADTLRPELGFDNSRAASGMNPQSLGFLDPGRYSMYQQEYLQSISLASQIDGLFPAREAANHGMGKLLLIQLRSLPSRWERSHSPPDGPSAPQSRAQLLEMLLQQRRLTEKLLALRRQQEK